MVRYYSEFPLGKPGIRRGERGRMDFESFCERLQKTGIEPKAMRFTGMIRDSFEDRVPLKPRFHKMAMRLWLTFLITGGAAESVDAYIEALLAARKSGGTVAAGALAEGGQTPAENRSDVLSADLLAAYTAADRQKREILAAHRTSIDAIHSRYRGRVKAIFEKLPELLSAHEKKVNFRKITEGTYGDQYAQTFEWMDGSGIFNLCRRAGDPNAGLAMTASDGSVKCYLADTGLLLSHAYSAEELADGSIYSGILQGKLSLDGCMLFENAVAQTLAAHGNRLFYYVHYSRERHRNDIDIDFVIQDKRPGSGSRMIPVEVKTGRNYSTVSMKRFREKYGSRIADCFIVHPRNLEEKDGIRCIPPYMAWCI